MGCSADEIGKRVTSLREKRGLTQKELAKELVVSRQVVAKWENGLRDMKTQHTVRLADFFDVSCDYILRGVSSEHLEIYKTLGLKDESIEELNSAISINPNIIPYLNAFVGNFAFHMALESICSAVKHATNWKEWIEQAKTMDRKDVQAINNASKNPPPGRVCITGKEAVEMEIQQAENNINSLVRRIVDLEVNPEHSLPIKFEKTW